MDGMMDTLEGVGKVLLYGSLVLPLLLFPLLLGGKKRRKNARQAIEQDSSGMLKRYPETEFTVHEAFGDGPLTSKERRKRAAAKDLSKAEDKPILVIDYQAGLKAEGHESFAALVDEALINAENLHEVVVRISSTGGMAHLYGYLFSQMERLRAGVDNLTVALDTAAASGGMWMALPAKKIIATPSSIVGSLGAMSFRPNVYHLLNRLGVKIEAITAGKDKFTGNPFADPDVPTESESSKESLKVLQDAMLASVRKYRGEKAKLDELASARIWTAAQSVELGLGLVDQLSTSDAYLFEANRSRDLIEIGFQPERGLPKLLSKLVCGSIERLFTT
jgi:serine protease SohB